MTDTQGAPSHPARVLSWVARLDRDHVDTAVALIFSVLVVAVPDATFGHGSNAAAAFRPLLVTVPLAGRRRAPMVCFGLQLVGVLIAPATITSPFALTALALGAYTAVGLTGRPARIAAAIGAVTVVALLRVLGGHGSLALILAVIGLLGNAVRSLRLRAQAAERSAEALRHEQAAAQELALQKERARVARELHDVVGHHVSVMLIQAGAARSCVGQSSPARQALLEVESSGRVAMNELRHLLSLLGTSGTDRSDGDDEYAPQPRLADIEQLVERIRAAGLPVSVTIDGSSRPADPGVELAAYRTVQEALTNALKYAGGATTSVTIRYAPDALRVTVRDHGRTYDPGQGRRADGRGLLGLRERVALYGGTFHAGRGVDGGYQVSAEFPLTGS